MGCLKLQEENKGTIIYMNDNKKKTLLLKSILKWVKKHGSEIAVGVVVTAICAVANLAYSHFRAQPTIDSVSTEVADLSTEVKKLSKKTSKLADTYDKKTTEISSEIGEMKEEIAALNGFKDTMLSIPSLYLKVDEGDNGFMESASVEANDISTVGSGQLDADTYIGTDSNGVDYIAEEWVGKTVLISYQEDGKEVYFLGQYNENYHWDGYCVTNAYSADGTLYGICESNFDDGKRLDYVSLYYSGDNEWIYANRELINDENVGVTVNYYIEDNKVKNFTTTNVRVTDILYADAYIGNIDKHITKYYTGNTVNNVFSDSTGNAYEVKYDTDGTVKMLYVGRFVDGYCNDVTGEAFSIVYSDEYNAYFYNTGKFINGNAEKHSDEPITIDEINKIIKEYSFDCELKWKQES